MEYPRKAYSHNTGITGCHNIPSGGLDAMQVLDVFSYSKRSHLWKTNYLTKIECSQFILFYFFWKTHNMLLRTTTFSITTFFFIIKRKINKVVHIADILW